MEMVLCIRVSSIYNQLSYKKQRAAPMQNIEYALNWRHVQAQSEYSDFHKIEIKIVKFANNILTYLKHEKNRRIYTKKKKVTKVSSVHHNMQTYEKKSISTTDLFWLVAARRAARVFSCGAHGAWSRASSARRWALSRNCPGSCSPRPQWASRPRPSAPQVRAFSFRS